MRIKNFYLLLGVTIFAIAATSCSTSDAVRSIEPTVQSKSASSYNYSTQQSSSAVATHVTEPQTNVTSTGSPSIVYEGDMTLADSVNTGSTMEAAADAGVMKLIEIFGLNLAGETVSMRYSPASNEKSAFWSGRYSTDSTNPASDYSFQVDALSGKIKHVLLSRTWDGEELSNPDGTMRDMYEDNPESFTQYARQAADKATTSIGEIKDFRLLSEPITSEFMILYEATGVNGLREWFMFSKHDRALTAVVLNDGIPEIETTLGDSKEN